MAAVLSAEGASGEKPGVERSGISANLLQQGEGAITHLSRRDQSEGSLARSAGKKKKDPSSPVGTVDQVSCKYVFFFPRSWRNKNTSNNNVSPVREV